MGQLIAFVEEVEGVWQLGENLLPGMVRVWELYPPSVRSQLLTYLGAHLDEIPQINQALQEVPDGAAFISSIENRAFSHVPTSGAIVYEGLENGTFLIGGFPPDLINILDELGYPKMDPLNLSFPVPVGQKFNLLNVSDAVYEPFINATPGFFTAVNGPWIDAAVSQGVPIIVVSDVNLHLYKVEDNVTKLTGFGKEVHRLEYQHGYRYDPATRRMLPPGSVDGLPTLTNFSDYP